MNKLNKTLIPLFAVILLFSLEGCSFIKGFTGKVGDSEIVVSEIYYVSQSSPNVLAEHPHEKRQFHHDLTEELDTIETIEQLDEIVAFMSENFVTSMKFHLKDIEICGSLNGYYHNNNGVLPLYGVREIAFAYIENEDFFAVEITLHYEMYINALIAHETGDFSDLTDEELSIYGRASWIVSKYINEDMSKFERADALHRYLTDTVEYEHDYDNNPNAFTIYGALLDGRAVCQGYTQAYKLLLHMAGIESLVVSGVANDDNHCWNLVNYGSKDFPEWYNVDVTWDDREEDVSHRYFNVKNELIYDTHEWNKSLFPAADSNEFNYFIYTGAVAYSPESLQRIFTELYSEDNHFYEIVCFFDIHSADIVFLCDYTGTDEIKFSINDYGRDKILTVDLS